MELRCAMCMKKVLKETCDLRAGLCFDDVESSSCYWLSIWTLTACTQQLTSIVICTTSARFVCLGDIQ